MRLPQEKTEADGAVMATLNGESRFIEPTPTIFRPINAIPSVAIDFLTRVVSDLRSRFHQTAHMAILH